LEYKKEKIIWFIFISFLMTTIIGSILNTERIDCDLPVNQELDFCQPVEYENKITERDLENQPNPGDYDWP